MAKLIINQQTKGVLIKNKLNKLNSFCLTTPTELDLVKNLFEFVLRLFP